MQIHTFRLGPGQDLSDEIDAFIAMKNIEAGCVLSSVGSLTHATLRLANNSNYSEYDGYGLEPWVTSAHFHFRQGRQDHRRTSRQRMQNLHHRGNGYCCI